MEKVTSLEHLKELASNDNYERVDFFILLAGGIARSYKQIYYDKVRQTFDVVNEIDFSFQDDLTEEQLARETHIVDAIDVGALYKL